MRPGVDNHHLLLVACVPRDRSVSKGLVGVKESVGVKGLVGVKESGNEESMLVHVVTPKGRRAVGKERLHGEQMIATVASATPRSFLGDNAEVLCRA